MSQPARQRSLAKSVIILSLAAIVVLLAFDMWRGRNWVLSGIHAPAADGESNITLLFHSPELNAGQRVMESLQTEASIAKELGGSIESHSYTMPIVGLCSVKISAPSKNMDRLQLIVKEHLASHHPSLHPRFFASGKEIGE